MTIDVGASAVKPDVRHDVNDRHVRNEFAGPQLRVGGGGEVLVEHAQIGRREQALLLNVLSRTSGAEVGVGPKMTADFRDMGRLLPSHVQFGTADGLQRDPQAAAEFLE